MATPKFIINLKTTHEKSGLSPYAVAKEAGLAKNTVLKYVLSDRVVIERFESSLLILMRFYGVDWRDPEIVQVDDIAC